MRTKINSYCYLIISCIFLYVPSAHAAQCNITVTPLNFGSYDSLSTTPTDTNASININCRTPKTQMVSLQLTSGTSGSASQRSMSHSAGVGNLYYNIYTTPGRNQIIGDGSGGSMTLSQSVDRNSPWNLVLYGRIDPLQNIPVGTYSDILTATIFW